MNRFIIVNGLPYLYADGKAYAVRWDSAGFTVGAEVKLKSTPAVTYSELSIKAQCANKLDSIGAEPKAATASKKKVVKKAVKPDDYFC